MLAHWRAVEALATELIETGRIEGRRIERIIDRRIRINTYSSRIMGTFDYPVAC